ADLYLAFACGAGIPGALAAFESKYMARVPSLIARLDPAGRLADEVIQTLRVQILVPDARGRARILDYSGRGALIASLRVSAIRATLKLRRSQRRAGADGPSLPEVAGSLDPERDYLKLRYGPHYATALRAALDSLESPERLLLKLHYVDGLNIERIGALY